MFGIGHSPHVVHAPHGTEATAAAGLDLKLTSPSLSTDNAAMIAYAALERFSLGYRSDINEDADPNLKLV